MPKHERADTTGMEKSDSKSRESCANMTSGATSEVEDDLEERENKDAVTTTEADMKQTKLKTAERVISSQETEKMADRDSNSKKRKSGVTSRVSDGGGRKTWRMAVVEKRDGSHKHSKSARKKHQTLLKQKLKQRKTVSEARLKSYGLAL